MLPRPVVGYATDTTRAGDAGTLGGAVLRRSTMALDARGVGFRSLTESLDATISGGRLVFHLSGALAEWLIMRVIQSSCGVRPAVVLRSHPAHTAWS